VGGWVGLGVERTLRKLFERTLRGQELRRHWGGGERKGI